MGHTAPRQHRLTLCLLIRSVRPNLAFAIFQVSLIVLGSGVNDAGSIIDPADCVPSTTPVGATRSPALGCSSFAGTVGHGRWPPSVGEELVLLPRGH